MLGKLLFFLLIVESLALLYPKDSPSRMVKSLDGLWKFRADMSMNRNESFENHWYTRPLTQSGDTILMPVPSSYNDITQNSSLRDFIGWVWYERNFWVPSDWLAGKTRVVLRFESAHYYSIVYVNGKHVMEHNGGHLPFEASITNLLVRGEPNRVTVAVNNTLTDTTLPCGSIEYKSGPLYPPNYFVQNCQFDFFNYAGIQRSVKLYTTPAKTHIDDITVVTTDITNGSATVEFTFTVGGDGASIKYRVSLGNVSVEGTALNGTLPVTGRLVLPKAQLWWPWTLSNNSGFLYDFEVSVTGTAGEVDVYRLAVGLRTVEVTKTKFLINGKPFYFHGVDKHEDADIRGKGLDYPLMVKDINLMKWLGVAGFRSSHYPYAEEFIQLCEKEGIAIIDESPAVGIRSENYKPETLQHHQQVMKELIQRDKNSPAVVMWSVANEPDSADSRADSYFKSVVDFTRSLDKTRPISFACSKDYDTDKATQYMDVVMFNRYYGWYQETGHCEVIPYMLSTDLDKWFEVRQKPLLISEYGAGTVEGLHKSPSVAWSEEYQVQLLMSYWTVFDEYRNSFLIGELIWNFQDFETPQGTGRVDGNKKGLITRDRQPKMAAHYVRQRYHALSEGRDFHPEPMNFF